MGWQEPALPVTIIQVLRAYLTSLCFHLCCRFDTVLPEMMAVSGTARLPTGNQHEQSEQGGVWVTKTAAPWSAAIILLLAL
jgi:hypothetical protein